MTTISEKVEMNLNFIIWDNLLQTSISEDMKELPNDLSVDAITPEKPCVAAIFTFQL